MVISRLGAREQEQEQELESREMDRSHLRSTAGGKVGIFRHSLVRAWLRGELPLFRGVIPFSLSATAYRPAA